MSIARKMWAFLLPGFPIWLLIFCLHHGGALGQWSRVVGQAYPYLVFLAGGLLGWRFNRNNLVLALIALISADRLMFYLAPDNTTSFQSAVAARHLLAVLLPANFLAFALLRERRLLTAHGVSRVALVVIQIPFVVLAARYPNLRLNGWLDAFPAGLEWLAVGGVPPVGMLVFLTAGVALLLVFLGKGTAIEGGLFWALVCAFSALAVRHAGPAPTIYLSTAGLILVVSVIETSFRMAFRDELTGLPGRRAMSEMLSRIEDAYAVAMLDVDHFKRINDRYGHDVGDQVLRMVAARLLRVPQGGKAFRFGGEEFAVIFPNTAANEARLAMEYVRRTVAAMEFVIRARNRPRHKPDSLRAAQDSRKRFVVTFSAGIAESGGGDDHGAVIKAADEAMYQAKSAGRNRVCLAAPREPRCAGAGEWEPS